MAGRVFCAYTVDVLRNSLMDCTIAADVECVAYFPVEMMDTFCSEIVG